MEIHMIRHGRTEANEKRLYCGQTDLPLSAGGAAELAALKRRGIYPLPADIVCTSGMLRAEQTVDIIYGKVDRLSVPDIAEYNFGLFEAKSHDMLKDREDYRKWLADESGSAECPGGESRSGFAGRVIKGYLRVLGNVRQTGSSSVLVACHGGTIACVMEYLRPNTKNFYGWQPQPGRGYTIIYNGGQFYGYKNI